MCLKCLSARSAEEDMDGSFNAKGTPSPIDLLRLILYFINFPFFCCLSPTCLLSFSSSSLSPLTSSSTFLSFFQNSVGFFLSSHSLCVCVCVCAREKVNYIVQLCSISGVLSYQNSSIIIKSE